MMRWWQKKPVLDLIEGYEKISDREQKIVLIGIVGTLSILLYMLTVEPLIISYQEMSSEHEELSTTNRNIKKQLEITLTRKYQDPNLPLIEEIGRLEAESIALDEDISRLTTALVAPKQMVKLLENVLENDSKMKLISLVNLPKEDVTFYLNGPGDGKTAVNKYKAEEDELKKRNKDEEGLIYKHAFEIEMKATYSSTVNYLKRLDKLPWKVFWQDLNYEVATYPNGNLKIKIYTLSTSREVLGV
jgi:MSHA biogenesis protein MshJ